MVMSQYEGSSVAGRFYQTSIIRRLHTWVLLSDLPAHHLIAGAHCKLLVQHFFNLGTSRLCACWYVGTGRAWRGEDRWGVL